MGVADLVGKPVFFATARGGESIVNAAPADLGFALLGADMTATFKTPAHYVDGPYEIGCVISLTGSAPPNLPALGDLAAFDLALPPPGDPPNTGLSLRVHVAGGDGERTFVNGNFIRIGRPE
jgi:hypothetical protein